MSYKISYKTYVIAPENQVLIEEHSFKLKSLFKPSYKQIKKVVRKRVKESLNAQCILVSDIECRKEKRISKK